MVHCIISGDSGSATPNKKMVTTAEIASHVYKCLQGARNFANTIYFHSCHNPMITVSICIFILKTEETETQRGQATSP